MKPSYGLGTRLRQLLAALDGDVQQIYDSLDAPFRPRFFPVVGCLLASSPRRVGDLAAEIGVSQPAATQTIGEMARLGLVSPSQTTDRRARMVTLTPEGERLAVQLAPVWAAVEAAVASLDRELACPLSSLIDQALTALEREPFHDRIREAMTDD